MLPSLPPGAAGGTTPAFISGTSSVSGNTLTFSTTSQADGTKATIVGTTNYKDFSIVVTVTATVKQPQTISFTSAKGGAVSATYGDAAFTHTAAGGGGTGAVTYESSNPVIATVTNAGAITIIGAGHGGDYDD